MSRVEDLEQKAEELQIELDALLDEYVRVKRQLVTLEAATSGGGDTGTSVSDISVGATDGQWPDWSGPVSDADIEAGAPSAGDTDASISDTIASQEAVDAAVREVEIDDERRTDDIIIG